MWKKTKKKEREKEKNLKEMVRSSHEGMVYFSLTLSDPFMKLKKIFKRQRVITHSWEIIVSLPNSSGLASLCRNWGSKTSLTHLVASSRGTKRKHISFWCYRFILVPLRIIIVQCKLFFWFYLMHRCSCKTQNKVLCGCCWTDWLKKCRKQQNIIFDTTNVL